MDFYFDLSLIQSQKIILTPQLKQALEILKMNSQELTDYLQYELETNPAMEINPAYYPLNEEIIPINIEEPESDYVTASEYTLKNDGIKENEDIIPVDRTTLKLSLKEHMLMQLHTSSVSQKEAEIGEYLIDNIDENGYLAIDISEAASFFNMPSERIENTLKILQSLDPPGVCARDLKECLLIQLSQMGIDDKDILMVVEGYLDELADNRLSRIAKKTGLTIERVSEILELIKTLEPRPGREFYSCDDTKFIVPDVFVKEINGKYEVLINEDSLPIVNVSSYYKNIMKEDINIEARKFIRSKIDGVLWLIKCIQQRKNTLIKVTEYIVSSQIEFFQNGKQCVRPLTMKGLAVKAGVHESTVSRAISGKYLQCSWGVFEMRYFFPSRVSSGNIQTTGENIKIKIKEMIKAEDKKQPLSDNDITVALKNDGIDISRRTVAKYRTQINIPAMSKRKKF